MVFQMIYAIEDEAITSTQQHAYNHNHYHYAIKRIILC